MDSRLTLPANIVIDGNYRILRVVGSGGFGITYEAEDINLRTIVAIKEYYPLDFGDRDRTMSVRPKSERHKQPFDHGRSSFLEEARTLARFEHPSIVRVSRVFEWNSNAYMVMRFEGGQSFEAWLAGLARPPTQGELDSIAAPLLDALQVMHEADFLHRDIAPDNIIVRADGTPVLLDFGAARRAMAALSRSLTGIIKAGYSPHEQYAADRRLQGPWSDFYAFGATLYRAVTGNAPEEATLRVSDDRMAPASKTAKGTYRPDFLRAIDACLKVGPLERPQSVAQLRPMLLGQKSPPATEHIPAIKPTRMQPSLAQEASTVRRGKRRWPAIAATMLAVLGGIYAGYAYKRANMLESLVAGGHSDQAAQAVKVDDASEKVAAAAQRQAALDAEKRQRDRDAADLRQHQIEIEEARRRREQADAVEAEARRKAEAAAEQKRREEVRIAALEAASRKEADARRKAEADAEEKRREESRVAALEEARINKEKRLEEERIRLAAIPEDDKRAEFVRKIQSVLKRNGCYDGALNGRASDAQEGLSRFADNAKKRGESKPPRIELAKASVGDFKSWLRDADAVKAGVCMPPPKPPERPKVSTVKPERSTPAREERPAPARREKAEEPAQGRSCPRRCWNRPWFTGCGGC